MKSVPLQAYQRTQVRRGEVKKLRAAGRVPATIYGRQASPQNLELNSKEVADLINHSVSETILVDLAVENDARAKRLALVQEVQHHPLDRKVLHVDFHEVAEDEKVTIQVPLETDGRSGRGEGGRRVLEHVLFKLKVRSLPKDLPEQIVVDVSALELGKTIHLGDLKAPAGVEILGGKHISVISCALPRTEAEEDGRHRGRPGRADVEMIKEKKEDGTEEAPAKAGEKAGDKAAAKPGDKAAAKPGEKGPAKAAEKGAEKKPEAKAEKKK